MAGSFKRRDKRAWEFGAKGFPEPIDILAFSYRGCFCKVCDKGDL